MRQRYIDMRNSNRVDMILMYEYFKENGGTYSMQQFNQMFGFVNINEVLDFMDHKFELTSLHNKEGMLIMVVN